MSTNLIPETMMAADGLSPMVPRPHTVQRVRQETYDTFTLELASAAGGGESEFLFSPGQFNMLYVFGVGEVAISISGDPARPEKLVHTIRAVGATTKALGRLRRGDTVGVRGPFGSQWPAEAAAGRDVIIIAGGIGLAPLRPVVYHILRHRAKYGNVALLYGARTPADLLYAKELEQWRGRFDVDVQVTVDRADASWRGTVGVVTTFIPRLRFDPSDAVAMICGPEIMMRFAVQELEEREIQSENIYISMERNMKCAVGFCGHCQFGPTFICKDGPVFSYESIKALLAIRGV
ncbi:MAG TPA: FAD/NAD(P)-binding protein [Terriglobia bacterium]|nr:FAD/NAD(P)-binding protein [Terriglobia bacterium]